MRSLFTHLGGLKGLSLICITVLIAACGGGGGDNGDGSDSFFSDGSTESGDCAGGGWCGSATITVTADISGAKSLLTLQDNSASVVSNVAKGASKALVGTESKFYKLLEDGSFASVITASSTQSSDATADLPPISYIASNDLGDVFIAFEHPFMYQTPPDEYSDPWSPSSPYTCQLFRVNSTITEAATGGADTGLCCITNTLELNTWDFRTSKIQFDSSGNAYFTAHVPQNWKDVMIKWTRSATPTTDDNGVCTYPSTALSEVINANIVFRDYLVVPTGGVFYTGITSTNGDYSGGNDSFLRFRADGGALQEITSGWWDYVFAPVGVDDALLGIDTSIALATSVSERVLFYGPDPLLATSPDWNDSCLYLYDPNLSGAARSTEIADCEIDIYNYVNWADDLATKKSRCTEAKYMMGGNNQPKKILLADSYDVSTKYIKDVDYAEADGKKEIFVVGDVFAKKAGEWRFDICIDEAHCTIDGVPSYTHNTANAGADEAACTAASGTWNADNDCYNQLVDAALLSAIVDGSDATWQINGQWCETPGTDWRDTYSGIVRVNYTDADTKSVTLLSDTDEIVRNGWVVNSRVFFSTFNVTDGSYHLMEVGNASAILDGYEVYELFKDPNNANGLYFNGLRFSDNAYVMGTFEPDDVDGTFEVESGITGQIETLIVIPDALLQ